MSATLATRALCAVLQRTKKRRFATTEAGARLLAAPKGPVTPVGAVLRGRRITSSVVAGFPVHRVEPRGGVRRTGATAYFHGGGYVSTIARQHWDLVADLADVSGRPVHVPHYGLAPQHTALEAIALGLAVVDSLAASDAAEGPLRLAGDSAGGGLVVLLGQHLRDAGGPIPDLLTVIAPWLDLAMSHPELDAVEPTDPWLSRAGLRPVADVWAAELELTDPRISPIHGSFADLPPIEAHVGSRDLTAPDTRLLVERVLAAGGQAVLHEEVGSPHVHPLLPTPEGRRARATLLATLGA
ncbi:alpha/beta hydrolase fold domain-containing protein [Nocardioides daejeonensis]|uniref:alpha/beta hydrolase fold domain-containing protein n=1 Tax=Nocardioides daejeonensis TaxID=1046556 RepID=UPI00195286A7|nr:alpha/beta hydrolase [Nocardioides daejeonensis]